MLENIAKVICNAFHVTLEDLRGQRGKEHVATARQFFCLFAKTYTNLSLREIGKFINRGHSDVIHSITKIRGFIETYPDMRQMEKDIKADLTGLLDVDKIEDGDVIIFINKVSGELLGYFKDERYVKRVNRNLIQKESDYIKHTIDAYYGKKRIQSTH